MTWSAFVRWVLGAAVATTAGCLSSAGALPPVRWFDPTPAAPVDAVDGRAPIVVVVQAPPHLGREFLVRVGVHEVAVDAEHQWLREPRDVVGEVIGRALARTPTALGRVEVALEVFELDVTAAPAAHVRVAFRDVRPNALPAVLTSRAPAVDRSPAAFAAAMAQALAQLEARVQQVP